MKHDVASAYRRLPVPGGARKAFGRSDRQLWTRHGPARSSRSGATSDADCYDDKKGDGERDELPSCDATGSAEQRNQ